MSDTRLQQLTGWLAAHAARLGLRPESIRPASDDASFRRYFRIDTLDADRPSVVAMDAPPHLEDVRPFLRAARVLAEAGMQVPQVLVSSIQGIIILLVVAFGALRLPFDLLRLHASLLA